MGIKNIKDKLVKSKRGIALGMAVLMGGMALYQFNDLSVVAYVANAQAGGNVYWNEATGPMMYYGKNRSYFGHLRVNGKGAICLDATKKLNTGRTGNIAEYAFDGSSNFPTGISRDGAEMLSYAIIMGGGGNGREISKPTYYILCQTLCWMAEAKGGNVTWEDLEEWKIQTKELANHLKSPYNQSVKDAIDTYCENATRQLRPEAVASFMSKYASEAPPLELNYDENTGLWTNDFELIDYGDALAQGFDQVWMQYFLDYDKAVVDIGLDSKLKMEHKAEGTRNWVHVEFNGDIEELKAVGPIRLEYPEGDGKANTFGLNNMSIWTPADSGQQHLLADVQYDSWYVYMSFGNRSTPTPGPTGDYYTVTVDTRQHDETFVSNYNIDLNKFDFETGEPLENAEFEILERMDTSQFDDSVDHNGGNDGTYPLDDLNFDKFKKVRDNTVKPTDDWQVCGSYTTDANGVISHTDVFKYDFTATYCDGHPDPVITYPEEPEIPEAEEGEEPDTSAHDEWEELCAQIDAAAQEAWEKAVAECEARTNFHFK